MKRFLFAVVVIGLAIVCMPVQSFSQAADTVTIVPTPPGNINTVLNSDTLAGGVRAHPNRVYKLRRGTIYQVTAPIRINGNLNLIANDSAGIRPPVMAPAILQDNSSVDHFFDLIGKKGKVALSNIWMLNQRADQVWPSWADGFRIGADSVSLKLRGVIGEGWSNCFIVPSYWLKFDAQDCEFRNQQNTGSWFGGQVFRGAGAVCLDTTKVINCTFLANNSYAIDIRGYTPLAVFEHNTMVYSVVNPFLTRQAVNTHIKNNIFYAQHAMGGNPDHVINSWFLNYPDTASSAMIQFRAQDTTGTSYWSKLWWDVGNNRGGRFTGPEAWVDPAHNVTAAMLDPTKWVYEVKNNDWFLPTKLTNFYKTYNDTTKLADSVDVPVFQGAVKKMYLKRILYTPTYITASSKYFVDSVAKKLSPFIDIQTTPISADPGFATNITNHVDSLIAYVHSITTGTIGPNRWAFPNNTLYPPTWPLPENLAYTNASLQSAGTDGFALGDLNWFPTQKANWLKATSVELVTDQLPQGYSLSQNYPNPFNPSTMIQFSIPKQSMVTLKVYNLLGQEVATLVNGTLGAGSYKVNFDAAKYATGTYVYRMTADNFVQTSKMLLIK